MAKHPLSDGDFNTLRNRVFSETSEKEKKFETLYYSKGNFTGVQVSMYVTQELSSGAHQMYSAMGSLYNQCFPGRESLYGPVNDQIAERDHTTKPSLPVSACTNPPPSAFQAAPSYLYMGDQDRSWYLGGGRPPLPPPVADTVITGPPMKLGEKRVNFVDTQPNFPANDPCLTTSQGGPAALGFPAIKPLERTDCC